MGVEERMGGLPGGGMIWKLGGGDSGRGVWLDPDKVASGGLTAGDVVRAIQEQNLQVSAGQLGAEPIKDGADFLIAINAHGRLRSTEEFGNVVLKTGANAEVVRLPALAHIDLPASHYTIRSQLPNSPTAT